MGNEPARVNMPYTTYVPQNTYQPNKIKTKYSNPGENEYRRWTDDQHLIKLPKCKYEEWKRWIIRFKDLKFYYSVDGSDGYTYIYVKWWRRIVLWNDHGEMYLRPWKTYQENMRYLHSKGKLYEHKVQKGKSITYVGEDLTTDDIDQIIAEATKQTKRESEEYLASIRAMSQPQLETGQVLNNSTNQSIAKPVDQPTSQPTNKSADKKISAKEILELTPEQALEQLTLEEYDLYCKYKNK